MLKALFRRKPERDRIESSPVSEHLDPFAVALASQKYPTRTIGRYVFAADRFGRWLVARGQIVGQIDDHVVDEYLLSVGRTRRAGWPRGRLPTSAFGARRFVEFLRRSGVMAMADAGAPESEVDRWVAFYDQHLERVAGLCGGTRRRYCSYARRLIVFCLGEQRLDWSALGADRIAEFVGQEAAKLNPAGSRGPVTAVRAVIRYLVSQGSVRAGLDGAVPTVRQWRHASLPEGLSVDEVQRVLSLCESGDDVATRDRAILLLLARLGLRAGEVAGLDIEHIHWSRGEILVAAGKSGRDRLLPLSEEVGAALVAYLRQRLGHNHRRVFLIAQPPHGPLAAASVSAVAARYLRRADVPGDRCHAHALRHMVATQMVRRGVPFKQVADVLGHAHLATTAIYAKLNLEALSGVALPWPGATP